MPIKVHAGQAAIIQKGNLGNAVHRLENGIETTSRDIRSEIVAPEVITCTAGVFVQDGVIGIAHVPVYDEQGPQSIPPAVIEAYLWPHDPSNIDPTLTQAQAQDHIEDIIRPYVDFLAKHFNPTETRAFIAGGCRNDSLTRAYVLTQMDVPTIQQGLAATDPRVQLMRAKMDNTMYTGETSAVVAHVFQKLCEEKGFGFEARDLFGDMTRDVKVSQNAIEITSRDFSVRNGAVGIDTSIPPKTATYDLSAPDPHHLSGKPEVFTGDRFMQR